MKTRSLLLLLAALLFAGHVLRYQAYLVDDAYISLRYAHNLVDGEGLVFNPGERVEGYTNFLWVITGAAFLAAKLDAMRLLGGVSFAAALGLLAIAGRLEKLGGRGRTMAALWILPLAGFGYWATTGMESMLFTALFALAVLLTLGESRDQRFRGSVFVFVLLALTRPEGVLCFALGLLGGAVASRLWHRRWTILRPARDVLVFALTYGVYFVWRWRYYGELLPNTFHAKVTGGVEQWRNGLINLGGWALVHPLFAVAVLTPAALWLAGHRRRLAARPELVALWLIIVGWLAYVAAIGGDFMPFLRFFLPVLPLAAVLLVWTAALLRETLPARFVESRGMRWAVAGAFAVHVMAGLGGEEPYRAFVAHRTTVVGQEVGRFFGATYAADEWIAVNTAGSLPYESGLPTIDMLGLNDAAIARHPVYVISPRWAGHRRGWGEYVLSRRPRAVVWYNSAGLAEPHYLGDHQLADDASFRFFYQLHRRQLTEDSDEVLARFPGAPFGEASSLSPELGVRFEVHEGLLRHTVARAAPITLHYFELRRDRDEFWPLREQARDDPGTFLGLAASAWREEAARRGPGDAEERRAVELLCSRALEHIQRGAYEAAEALLSQAARRNARARSPLVYQYIANLAVREKNLFLAVHAQQEALRLEPDNALYRRNLEHLLSVPFEAFVPRMQ